MPLYCTYEFRDEIEKLRKVGSHAGVEEEIIESYCNAKFEGWCTGDLLFAIPTGRPDALYVKKRLEGRGGFRAYGIAKVKTQSFYLGFIHPKTGRYGGENLTEEKKKLVAKSILAAIKNNELLEVKINKDKKIKWKLVFPVPVEEKELNGK